MKKYNVSNYVRYKEDLKASMPDDNAYSSYTRDELIIKFMPLVENLARKFSTTQQASGVLSINDLLQIGNEGLIRAVDKLDWEMLKESDDIEKTLKSFLLLLPLYGISLGLRHRLVKPRLRLSDASKLTWRGRWGSTCDVRQPRG